MKVGGFPCLTRAWMRATRRAIAGVERIIASTEYCWLLTGAEAPVRTRPMGRIVTQRGENRLTIRFLTDARSGKAMDLRRSPEVSVIFQKAADNAYVSMRGTARLEESRTYVEALWKEPYRRYFPTTEDRAHGAFIEVQIFRVELWVRGLTPDPFGVRPTILTRGPDGARTCAT